MKISAQTITVEYMHNSSHEIGGWNDVAEGHDPVEDHPDHLDKHHQGEEEHEDKAKRLQLQVGVVQGDGVHVAPWLTD